MEAAFNGMQAAHRKLLERVVDLELEMKHRHTSLLSAPPGMENLRPAYRSRASLIKEAQAIIDKNVPPKPQEVDKHGQVKRV